jgi:SAM-dependent methyltransferase
MAPGHRLLDIGCGSLRLGSLACRYLEPGHYWGTDLSTDLIEAGHAREIVAQGLGDRLPRGNLVTDGIFSFAGVPRQIDYAIANSVFTHLPPTHLRLCLGNLARHLTAPARVYFTIFLPQDGDGITGPSRQADGIVTWSYRDPFHYDWADVAHALRGLPWALRRLGDWGHPRNQMMVEARFDPARPATGGGESS